MRKKIKSILVRLFVFTVESDRNYTGNGWSAPVDTTVEES